MTQLSVSDFRNQMAMSFDRIDAGEHIFIRRKKQLYTIIPVKEDEMTITPKLAEEIEKARNEYREGKGITLNTRSDIEKWFDSL